MNKNELYANVELKSIDLRALFRLLSFIKFLLIKINAGTQLYMQIEAKRMKGSQCILRTNNAIAH